MLTGLLRIDSSKHKTASLTNLETIRSCWFSTDCSPFGVNLNFSNKLIASEFSGLLLVPILYSKYPFPDFRPKLSKTFINM